MRGLAFALILAAPAPAADREAFDRRLDSVSRAFLGVPYKLGPLGEGPEGEFDRDPLVRYDQFDCTTYVETVGALAFEPDKKRAEKLLQRIRYAKGRVGFTTRRHFTSVDWVPGLVAEGYLEDVTRQVAGEKTKVATKTIKKSEWYRAMSTSSLEGFAGAPAAELERRAAEMRRRGEKLADETVSLPYLPIESLPELLDKIPPGTIANLVREDLPDKSVLVTHQVFVFEKDGRRIVRHAAFGRRVEEQDALAYFYKYFNAKWRLLGLNLNRFKPR